MPNWTFNGFGHGGDYNPDQWLRTPGILDEDVRLMKLSKCNLMSVGIFSWAALEPEEGRFEFGWLDQVLDKLHAAGVSVLLATPSGARPIWMSEKYPEVLRVSEHGRRNLHGARHNHCYTSPVYRAFTRRINRALAERYGAHPAVVGWHISNEYGGECFCPLCQSAFQGWLERKYKDIDALNLAWWTGFWAHTYQRFDQVDAPMPHGEMGVHGLNIDWKRFVTDQTVDFMAAEIEPIRELTPNLPITTNMMGAYPGLDYFKFQRVLDVASHDLYPLWGSTDGDAQVSVSAAFAHDITRSILKKPFLLMESTPSMTNWQQVCKLKRPGMHLLSSMQAVAHGADTVQYFQWRKSRGSSEKLHGAVVDHVGHEHTRVFRDVAEVGEWLEKLAPVAGSATRAEVALIFDWNNRWAIQDAQGPRQDKQHDQIVLEHYGALLQNGVNVDVIDSEQCFDDYKLIACPMLYMLKPGVAERLEAFVSRGGQLLTTYLTGVADENDLCFLGGFPGPLRRLLGIWVEEIDALYEGQINSMELLPGNASGLSGEAECDFLLDLCHAEGAEVLAVYKKDFYQGMPALTRNAFGQGHAWHIAARTDTALLADLYGALMRAAGVEPLVRDLPKGIQVAERVQGGARYLFLMNFSGGPAKLELPSGTNMLTGEHVSGMVEMAVNQVLVIRR